MSFEDLAPDWMDQPLLDQSHTADVLDLFVGMRDRLAGGLFVLLCDEQRRPWQPIMISDEPGEPVIRPEDVPDLLAKLATMVTTEFPGSTAVAAIARPGSLRPSVSDLAMMHAVTRAFAGKVELLGVHLITPRGSVPFDAGMWQAA